MMYTRGTKPSCTSRRKHLCYSTVLRISLSLRSTTRKESPQKSFTTIPILPNKIRLNQRRSQRRRQEKFDWRRCHQSNGPKTCGRKGRIRMITDETKSLLLVCSGYLFSSAKDGKRMCDDEFVDTRHTERV